MSNTIGNIPVIDVDKSINILSTMYSNVINNNVELSRMPSVMLWGPPRSRKKPIYKGACQNIKGKHK